MYKKIILSTFFFILISSTIAAQNMITGTFQPNEKKYSWVMLYKLRGGKQVFLQNAGIIGNQFKIIMPSGTPKGIIRAVYSMDEGKYFDFIYNGESVTFTCNPDNTAATLTFENSTENKLYFNYLNTIENMHVIADSLQILYLSNHKRKLAKKYKKHIAKLHDLQSQYENKSKNMIAHDFIKANAKYYPKNIIETPKEYLKSTKEHFFDHTDFFNKQLKNSSVISKKIVQYVFQLDTSDDVDTQNKLYKENAINVLKKVDSDMFEKRNILELLLFNFSNIQNIPTVDYLLEEYKKLRRDIQSPKFVHTIEDKMRLAIGKKAPNFRWGNKKQYSLHAQKKAENYILIFWSSTCPHCLKEVPKLYEYTKAKKNLKVILVSLEDNDVGFNHYKEKFNQWTHVLTLSKWKDSIVMLYNVHSTPTYYILDQDKKIVANPEFFKDVKSFLEKKSKK